MSEQVHVPQATAPQQVAETEYEIDLMELLYRMLVNWKWIVCLALVCAIAFGAYTMFLVTPMYEAKATIYVLGRSDSAINLSDLQLGNSLTADYIKVFDMWEVHDKVINQMNLPYTYKQVQNMLSITNDANTRMLDIKVKSASPVEAANMANTYAVVASEYIAETMKTDKPTIMSSALTPVNPVSPSKVKNVVLGGFLGGVIACAFIAVRHLMDDKYKTADDIRKYTGLTTLAVVPIEHTDDSSKKNAKSKKKGRKQA